MGDNLRSNHNDLLRTAGRRWQYVIVAAILLVGTTVSIAAYLTLRTQEHKRLARDFDRASYDRIAAARKTLDFDLLTLQAVHSLYDSSEEVNRQEFRIFVNPFIEGHLSIHAIEWAPRVLHSERTDFEKAATVEGLANFRIREVTKEGTWALASEREAYFPVFFTEPINRDSAALGHDLASVPAFQAAMKRARDTGHCTFTPQVKIAQEVSIGSVQDPNDVWAFLPVYQKKSQLDTVEDRRRNLVGYIVGILNPKWIIKEGLASLMPAGINVALLDVTNPEAPELLYFDTSRLPPQHSEKAIMGTAAQTDLLIAKGFPVAGRRWKIVCTANYLFIDARTTWTPLLTATGLFLLTCLLGLYLIGIANKNTKITKLANQLNGTNQRLQQEITDRKQAEETLFTSETKLRMLYDASTHAIMYSHPERGMIGGNPAAIKLFGCKDEEEFTSYSPAELSPKYQPDGTLSSTKAQEMMQIAMERGMNYFEWTHKRLDGTEFPAIVLLTQIELRGEPMILGTIQDITAQRQAEEALQASEIKYKILYDASGYAIMYADPEKGFIDGNPAAIALFGCKDKEEFALQTPESLSSQYQPDGSKSSIKAQEYLDVALEQGTCYFEWMCKRIDGSEFPATVLLTKIEIAGKPLILATARDITEQKQLEAEQNLAAQRMESLLALNRMSDRSVEEIGATALEEAIRLTESKIGYLATMNEEETVLTLEYYSKTAHADCNTANKPIEYAVEATGLWGEAVRQRKPIITNDYAAPNPYKRGLPEGHIPLQRHMNIPVFEGEKIIAVAGVGNKEADYKEHDLTQLKLFMDGWHQILLRKKFEQDLAQARDDAEAATRAKSQFLATMSHEIRTPMTAILGYADLLLDPSLDTNTRNNYAVTIRRSGEHLLTLINDILDLSKIEAGKMTVSLGDCDLTSLLADVASIVRPRAQSHEIQFSIEYSNAVPETIQTDSNRLRQAIVNLSDNAIKFTDKGSVRIVVTFIKKEKSCNNEPAIQFQIIDTGIGISEAMLPQLFQPFCQGEKSITQKYGGTGLGLAISHRIAQLLGGDLTATSEWGKGSTFRLVVPTGNLDGVRFQDDSTEIGTGTKKTGWKKMAQNLQGLQILLAEDGEDNRRLIKTILSRAGAEVETAENGQLAVQQAKDKPFDLILMDMNMPVMDGYEATSVLRNEGFSKPILALTANAMAEDYQRCRLAGCDAFLTKPIDRTLLLQTIAKHARTAEKSNDTPEDTTQEKDTKSPPSPQ